MSFLLNQILGTRSTTGLTFLLKLNNHTVRIYGEMFVSDFDLCMLEAVAFVFNVWYIVFTVYIIV